MARALVLAMSALACLTSAALATPEPAKPGTPPPSSSHTPAQPEKKAPEAKSDNKKASATSAKPEKGAWVSDWRKAYIAKHGHAPGGADKAAPKKIAAKPLPKYKRCT